ncbi:superoxide dismutase [Flavobacterium sp. DG1-102-2]|uniref:superoxide dismutase n=1 Tax=Flavobacterium sp. DG1-102-2 TaxID=3081663 RepID=UPI002948D4AB|nr:superoxide dismutase [Flavobacterium sp. DG1-102-2]MDV6170087.1 superoxide dismutase [Flavobacterium sp. DG1-102-2]
MTYILPKLEYAYNALEPFIDAKTMEIHHAKHHQAYVDNLNKGLQDSGYEDLTLDEIFEKASELPPVLRNNSGGHYNHSLFWKLLTPNAKKEPTGQLAEAINVTFGSFTAFQEKFAAAAMGRFGSGWTWLFVNEENKLEIGSTPNQDNPIMLHTTIKGIPVLALDVWEHAYYISYQNRRADYITQFWNIINWDFAEKLYTNANQ